MRVSPIALLVVAFGVLAGCAFGDASSTEDDTGWEGESPVATASGKDSGASTTKDPYTTGSQSKDSGTASVSTADSGTGLGTGMDSGKDAQVDAKPDAPVNATIVEVVLLSNTDCVTVSCPASAPFAVGCTDEMTGGSIKGCVASTPNGSAVFFKEGVNCDNSHHTGKLLCSATPGVGLNATNCVFNRADKSFVDDKSKCPN